MLCVDLNCDLGEGQPHDAAILAWITSANVACGVHAGDAATMEATVRAAMARQVSIGAHPGLPDRAGYGRVEMVMPADEIATLVRAQVQALAAVVARQRGTLVHVKLHGALYHQAARDPAVAAAVVRAVTQVSAGLILVGVPDSPLETAARAGGLVFAAEGFADRSYGQDGRLLPRTDPRAFVAGGDDLVAARAVAMVRQQQVVSAQGTVVAARTQTLCLHGDDPRAPTRAQAIRLALQTAGIRVAPLASFVA